MKWNAPRNIEVPEGYLQAVGVSPMVGELLIRRGYSAVEEARRFLYPEEYFPAPSTEIPDLDRGVSVVREAIREGKKIGVWGDFDVDGQTSTTLLVSAFKELGGEVIYHIPVRETESHGVNIPNLNSMLDAGIELLVTCDTGISAHTAVDYAKSQGVEVVITDHHDLPETLPQADAVINPSMLDERHPLFSLPGVGVAYKFVEHLFAEENAGRDPSKFLDLVALGIVADVAELSADTRYLLQLGLRVLRTTDRLGMQLLIKNAELSQEMLNAEDIGFSLAPRLNALGRLGDANVIVEFLTTEDEIRATVIAKQLEGLNAKRKLLTSQVYQAALEQIEANIDIKNQTALVLQGQNWPGGVIGIVAGRLAEKYEKPAVLLSVGEDDLCRGSARSVAGCDITAAISQCSDLLIGFGGHPMAAGMSLHVENFSAFSRCLDKTVRAQTGYPGGESPKVYDILVNLEDLSDLLLGEVNQLAPFGHGNPEVLFAVEGVRLSSQSTIGRAEEHRRLIVTNDEDHQVPLMWWRGVGEDLPRGKFNLVFSIKENHFRGNETLQVEYVDSWDDAGQEEVLPIKFSLQVVDLRKNDPAKVAAKFVKKQDLLIWGEAVDLAGFELSKRDQLDPAKDLFVVSLPPTQKVFRNALEVVKPEKIIILGIDPGMDKMNAFLKRLSGVCKYVVNAQNGKTNLSTLAGAMAHTQQAVMAGLNWLVAKGVFQVEIGEEAEIIISPLEHISGVGDLEEAEESLKILLDEAKAYRKYLRTLSSRELEGYLLEMARESYG